MGSMTDRCPSCDHDTQAHAPDGSGCLFEVTEVSIADDRICRCTFNAWKPTRCRANEGCTGIKCSLTDRHDGPHEGTYIPEDHTYDSVGYRMSVRWPLPAEEA